MSDNIFSQAAIDSFAMDLIGAAAKVIAMPGIDIFEGIEDKIFRRDIPIGYNSPIGSL
ncbi:hypothetical protein D3C85_1507320 [compost metagenome]